VSSTLTWQLLARLVAGQRGERRPTAVEAEVTALFGTLRAPLLRYLHSLGLPIADGEDIVQETFLSLFHHLRDDKPRGNLHGWIFRVGHNLALKRLTRIGRETAAVPNEVDREVNPEESAAWNARRMRLLAVVRALPERDRQCLFLRAEGLRYREIAEVLDMSLGAVAASLSRSLGKLASTS
jgi:RNA polymerase sigma-70 factor (ECF subfamily)